MLQAAFSLLGITSYIRKLNYGAAYWHEAICYYCKL